MAHAIAAAERELHGDSRGHRLCVCVSDAEGRIVSDLLQRRAEQFENAEQQRESSALGMWVFLATEVMFFGPLFLGYLFGRAHEAAAFAEASRHTDIVLGTLNTALLLTSSLCMALGVRALQADRPAQSAWLLVATALLGGAFLAIKGLEYRHEWQEALVPGLHFSWSGAHHNGIEFFFYLYFLLTGLH